TKDVMSAVDNVLDVRVNAESSHDAGCATQFTMNLTNNLRARQCIGELGAQSVGAGINTVTGTLQRYFESNADMDRYIAFSRLSLAVILDDAEGNQYVIDLPAVKFT